MRAAGFLLLVAAAITTVPAAAQEAYPFSGRFVTAGNPRQEDPLDARRCALSFFSQEPDGTFVSYHLDRDLLRNTGETKYLVFQRGRCTYQGSTRVESCHAWFDTNAEEQGRTFYSVIESVEAHYVLTVAFDTLTAALMFSQGGNRSNGYDDGYFRCPFNEAALGPALSTDVRSLDIASRDAVTASDSPFLSSDEVTSVARHLGLIQ